MCTPICRHCEQHAAVSAWGLCTRCDRTKRVRILYLHKRNRSAADEAILDRLRQRANAGLPLFPRDGG